MFLSGSVLHLSKVPNKRSLLPLRLAVLSRKNADSGATKKSTLKGKGAANLLVSYTTKSADTLLLVLRYSSVKNATERKAPLNLYFQRVPCACAELRRGEERSGEEANKGCESQSATRASYGLHRCGSLSLSH